MCQRDMPSRRKIFSPVRVHRIYLCDRCWRGKKGIMRQEREREREIGMICPSDVCVRGGEITGALESWIAVFYDILWVFASEGDF